MKKILSLALCCAMALMCLAGCSKELLTITTESEKFFVGDAIEVSVNKEGAIVTSSNSEVISVAEDGAITCVSAGTATLTATLKNEVATLEITVEESIFSSEPVGDLNPAETPAPIQGDDPGLGKNEGKTEAPTTIEGDEKEDEIKDASTATPAPTAKPTEKPVEPVATPTPTPEVKPVETPVPHTHSWSNATCTQAQKCSCGATSGSALGHAWKDATYEAPKTCTRCGATEGSAIPKPTPTPEAPKCGAVGHSSEGTCSVCGATYVKPAPTCGEKGHTTPGTCNVCGEILSPPPSACGSVGHSEKGTCSVCGKYFDGVNIEVPDVAPPRDDGISRVPIIRP